MLVFLIVRVHAAQQPGTWANVTPAGIDLSAFGTPWVMGDSLKPSDFYFPSGQGVFKSTDYGQTWSGPINTGTNGSSITSCQMGIAPGAAGVPTLLCAGINGGTLGFWRSTNGGKDWTNYSVPFPTQDVYPPSVDPYNANHLLITRHENNGVAQSFDGGQTWTQVNIVNGAGTYAFGTTNCPNGQSSGGMCASGGTGFAFFINTGNASTTADSWLWIEQGTGGAVGTWRTTNAGATWTQVSQNEHAHGNCQIYQAGNGVMYMGGIYAAGGWGVLRSADYGATWNNVVSGPAEATVFGTPNNVYSEYGWACGAGCNVPPSLEVAPQPGITGWTAEATPAAMTQGPGTAAVAFDGSNYIVVTGNWASGIWRYVEPAGAPPKTPARPKGLKVVP